MKCTGGLVGAGFTRSFHQNPMVVHGGDVLRHIASLSFDANRLDKQEVTKREASDHKEKPAVR